MGGRYGGDIRDARAYRPFMRRATLDEIRRAARHGKLLPPAPPKPDEDPTF